MGIKGSNRTQRSIHHLHHYYPTDISNFNRYGWRFVNHTGTFYAVQFSFNSFPIDSPNNEHEAHNPRVLLSSTTTITKALSSNSEDNQMIRPSSEGPQDHQPTTENLVFHCSRDTDRRKVNLPMEQFNINDIQQEINRKENEPGTSSDALNENSDSFASLRSVGSFVCRICQNAEHPERLVSPCSCKGTLSYVHTFCLEHWISTSGKTKCELCQFQYKTVQTLRYTCFQSLRMWYSHTMSRRALQLSEIFKIAKEDCQMFSLLTLVAFGIIGTILVGIQHYFVGERSNHLPTVAKIWTKGWLLFFLFATFSVYFLNVYILARGQLSPWYRWWQSAREIKLILENRKTFHPTTTMATIRPLEKPDTNGDAQVRNSTSAPQDQEVALNTICLNVDTDAEDNAGAAGGRRGALVPNTSAIEEISAVRNQQANNIEQQQRQHPNQEQPQNEQREEQNQAES